jgi:hypothetical protein
VKIWTLFLSLVLWVVCSGCSLTLPNIHWPWESDDTTPDAPVAPYQTNDETGHIVWIRESTDTLWEVVIDCQDGFQHGNDQEDVYRQGCVDGAKNEGIDALRVNLTMGLVQSDELAMHLLDFEHPDRPGYFLDTSWYVRSGNQGITRWQIIITQSLFDSYGDADALVKRVAYLFKAYPPGRVQFIVPTAYEADLLKKGVLRPIVPLANP